MIARPPPSHEWTLHPGLTDYGAVHTLFALYMHGEKDALDSPLRVHYIHLVHLEHLVHIGQLGHLGHLGHLVHLCRLGHIGHLGLSRDL